MNYSANYVNQATRIHNKTIMNLELKLKKYIDKKK